jgi:hypothetical protein
MERNGRILNDFEQEMLERVERIEERLQIGREPSRAHERVDAWPPPAYVHSPAQGTWDERRSGDDG